MTRVPAASAAGKDDEPGAALVVLDDEPSPGRVILRCHGHRPGAITLPARSPIRAGSKQQQYLERMSTGRLFALCGNADPIARRDAYTVQQGGARPPARAERLLRIASLLGALFVAVPAAGRAQTDSVPVTPGPHYASSGILRFFTGDGYRDLWTTPIRVPIADLDRLGGGLTAVSVGGGMTTETLHLTGEDGRRYVLRSVDKTVAQGLREELRGTIYEAVLQDQISAFLPTGALIVPPLLDAIGVLHTDPMLVVIPDSPRLEEFREQFAGQLALFEERPEDRLDGNPGFHGAVRVSSTPSLIENLRESATHVVDAREFLAARLVDLLVGDRDRSVNNWLWARFDTPAGRLYRPIPRDRDQAFIQLDGLLKWFLRFREPRLVKFADDAPAVVGLTRSAWDMDRPFLVALERAEWQRIVAETKAALSDAVIDGAVARLPRAHFEAVGATLAARLKARRDGLDVVADQLYRIVNQAADIHATDEAEVASAIYEDDGTLTISMARRGEAPYFRRSFHPDVTHEVRLYMLGGDDSTTVDGVGSAPITLRVIGGAGRDRYVDRTNGTRPPIFYDQGGGSEFVGGEHTRIRRVTFDPAVAWGLTGPYPPDWGSDVWPVTAVPFRGDLGFFPSAGIVFTTYGFRKTPFAMRHKVDVAYATAVSRFRAAYGLEWVASERARASLDAFWSQVELIRYHGLGNETGTDEPNDFYEIHHEQASFQPSVTLLQGRGRLRLGAYLRRSVTDTSGATLLAQERPYGGGTFSQLGGALQVSFDSRDDVATPATGVSASTSASWTPQLFNVDRGAFGAVAADVAARIALFGDRHVVTARAAARRVFGEFPIHDAAFLGGTGGLRGFRTDRFAGDASALGSIELRSHITQFRFLFPTEVGMVAFGDAGRVFVDGRSPGGWHTALGGGLWFAPVARAHTVAMTIARSNEYTALYLTAGFAF